MESNRKTRIFAHASGLALSALAGIFLIGCDVPLAGMAYTTDAKLGGCNDWDQGGFVYTGARPAVSPNVHVCLLRGLDDVFSVGLNALRDELSAVGIEAEVHSGPDWQTVGPQIVSARAQKTNPFEIILIGHSYGADDALRMASYFRDRGVPVRMTILLDATSPIPVPANIDICLHLYNLWPPGDAAPDVFSGNPVTPAVGNTHTIIRNEVVSPNNPDPGLACVDHFNIDASRKIHQRIISEIFALPE